MLLTYVIVSNIYINVISYFIALIYEYRLKWSGVPRIVREFHSLWRVITL